MSKRKLVGRQKTIMKSLKIKGKTQDQSPKQTKKNLYTKKGK